MGFGKPNTSIFGQSDGQNSGRSKKPKQPNTARET